MENIISYLKERGLIDEVSSKELEQIFSVPRVLYLGIDPTASSLHLGNLVGLVVLRMFQKFGHRPVLVMGGTTAAIGDPSGKSAERPLLSQDEINENIIHIKQTIQHCLDYSNAKTTPIIVNNSDWYSGMNVVTFLRDIGKQFRIGPMLGKDSVRTRLNSEEGMSFTEFTYQILQGYDFNYLHNKYNVELQIGGSDQYGNITAGIECTRKMSSKGVYGLSFPLLTRSDGKKFGKSEEGAIWLSREKLSPFQFYQLLLKFPDPDVVPMLKKLTFLPLEEISQIEKRYEASEMKPNDLQKIFAGIITEFVHGKEGLSEAKAATAAMAIGSAELNLEALMKALPNLPSLLLNKEEVIGSSYVELMSKAGMSTSKAEARKLIQNNGAYLNKVRVEDVAYAISETDLLDGKLLLLSSGKKKTLVIRIK